MLEQGLAITMATGRINKTSVDAAQPGDKDWLLWDDKLPGFGLKVTPAGSKVYIYQYRIGGRGAKVRRFTIGKHGKLTADKARKQAEIVAGETTQGKDPQREKVEHQRRSIELAFKPYAERFAEECLEVKWASTHKYATSLLTKHAVPILKDKALTEITRRDIRTVLMRVTDKPATAANLYAVLRRLFRWAITEGDIDASPMDGMESSKPPAARDRFLADDELAVVWQASERLGYPFGPMIRLLILTGARRDEVAGLSWDEMRNSDALWSLPASRAKNGLANQVPLSNLAIAELDVLAKRSGKVKDWPKVGFVFSTTGETAVSGFSRAKLRLDKQVAEIGKVQDDPVMVSAWRIHDLRRTLATGMQRLGVRFEVTEALLNHVGGSRSGVAGIYQRHDWAPEKVRALNAWSDFIAALLTKDDRSNVVPLVGSKA